MSQQQRPTSPLGYDRPLSPTAVSPDVYRRSVPGISDLVRGTTRSVLPDPYNRGYPQQRIQQHAVRSPQSGTAPVPYDVTVGQYEEPLHHPVVTARNQVQSVPVSVDRRLGGVQLQQQQQQQSPILQGQQQPQQQPPLPQVQASRTVLPASIGAAPRPTPVQDDLRALERRVARMHGSLNDLSEQMHVYQQQTVQRQDRLLHDVCKHAKDQSTMLNIILAGVVLTLLLALVTAIYTTIAPMLRGSGSGSKKGGGTGTKTTTAVAVQKKEKGGSKRSESKASKTVVVADDESMSEGIDSGAYARDLERQRKGRA